MRHKFISGARVLTAKPHPKVPDAMLVRMTCSPYVENGVTKTSQWKQMTKTEYDKKLYYVSVNRDGK